MQWVTRYEEARYVHVPGTRSPGPGPGSGPQVLIGSGKTEHRRKPSDQIFVQADNVGVLNTAEEKLGWIFTAFDADGGGSIDVEEIRLNILLGLKASLTMM